MKPSGTPRPPSADAGAAADLAGLRSMAMRLATRLEAAAASEPNEAAPLLGKNQGVIDGFAALAGIVIRIVAEERRAAQTPTAQTATAQTAAGQTAAGLSSAHSAPNSGAFKQSEQPFGQRIAAELDRVAARQRQAGFRGGPDTMPPGRS